MVRTEFAKISLGSPHNDYILLRYNFSFRLRTFTFYILTFSLVILSERQHTCEYGL